MSQDTVQYLQRRLQHVEAQYNALLKSVAEGVAMTRQPAIVVDVNSLSEDVKRQALIALGWTPPDATPFAYIPAWVPSRLDKYNHVTGHIAKNVSDKRDQYIAIYVKELTE